jgi:glycosyltransferase involved in cell wall biosynthesis
MGLAGATILQVTPEMSSGGVERTTVEIAEALVRAGARALVATAGGRMEVEIERVGGEVVRLPAAASKNPLDILGNARRLSALIRARGVDIVHARSRAPAWSAFWAARRTRRPFVTTYHGVYNARTALKRAYNSIMARGDVVIANSEFTADHVRAAHPGAASRVVAIPRGVDIARFSPEAVTHDRIEALRRAWSLPDASSGEAILVLPARLTPWKGHRQAIAAVSALARRGNVAWRLVLAGDPGRKSSYVAELKALASRERLEDRVGLVGHCEDMPAAFALADIVLAPSIEPEAFGRVAAEAGAMAKPVIASNIGGQREVVAHGETGLLTRPGDANALADALADLIARGPAGRAALGAAAQARIRRLYTVDALQQATLSVYAGLLEGRRAAR